MNDLPNAEEIYLRYIKYNDDRALETLLVTYREGLYLFLLGFVKNVEDALLRVVFVLCGYFL